MTTTNSKQPRRAKAAPKVTINVPLPADLHRQLRLKAVNKGTSMKDQVIAAIEAWTVKR
jgi:hypothetical protein